MSKQNATALNEDGLMLSGYQKKLKTMKKKYFVLYGETLSKVARLEYYDNERKFKSGLSPKRVIKLENCFNINRRLDTKYDYVIALSTKEGGFGIVLESEEEMLKWLEVLLTLQRRGFGMSDVQRPQFEHVWQVLIQRKGLAEDKGIIGSYHVCLTTKSVTFIRIGAEKNTSGDVRTTNVEIPLNTIRRCGDSQCFFYMEVGRQCTIGPGELWMETDDTMIAQNMHRMISSAMSAKTDANLEPMRKRSSSATEASKPLNVFHRKPNQPESKIFNSPQSTSLYYGRERCDSFPSRNRTSSECSNQSFTTSSVHTTRNTMLSGHRAPSYQRHSNSPPITSAVGCSESEESSISIDEADDNASFLYRFNSRSSEGVIPEENTEELICSESKYAEVSVLADNSDGPEENYVSMAPVNINKDAVEIKKFNPSKSITLANESKCVSSSSSLTCVLKTDFQEYSSDNVSKTYLNELNLQSERPTRAYSIGSKIEHNKINKRIGNTSETEQATTRVRAFSVGSRAKIPRCDLQRTILFPKYLIEKNFNSNNNLCSVVDSNACTQLLNINATRDKKSTSAPILIHKSHNSVDRMSDLMEIDFSKSPHYSSNRTQQSKTKSHFSKNISSTNREQVKKQDNITISVSNDESLLQTCSPSLPSTHQSISTTDSGYLEMKPVGSLLNKSPAANMSNTCNVSIEYTPNKPKMADSSVLGNKAGEFEKYSTQHNQMETNNKIETERASDGNVNDMENISGLSKIIPHKCILNSENQKSHVQNDAMVYNNHAKNIQTQNTNTTNLSSKYSQLTLNSTTKENSEKITDDYINIGNKRDDLGPDSCRDSKITKIKCNNTFSDNGKIPNPFNDTLFNYGDRNTSKQTIRCKELEVLQKKYDSSIQSHKPLNRPFLYKEKQMRCRQNQNVSQLLNSSYLISSSSSSSSTLCDSTPTSSSLPYNLPLTQAVIANTKETNHPPVNINPELNVTSRPSSLSSEHEIYYASLDLPPCRTDNIKTHNIDDDTILFAAVSVNNSYAKIDFDHSSDSSSSSSKNLNI